MKIIKILGALSMVVLLAGCTDLLVEQNDDANDTPVVPVEEVEIEEELAAETGAAVLDEEEAEKEVAVEEEADDEEEMADDSEEVVATASYQDISVDDAKNLIEMNPGLVIIDVSPKYDDGHLPGAINYYVGDGSLDTAIPTLDQNATYLVYCHVDSASQLGAQKLIDAGFPNVYRLEGNYAAWTDAGYPVE